MNIVDAILEKNKKYIIFISGLLWWDEFNTIIEALKTNLKFDVIYVNQLIPDNKLITSTEHINFPVVNEIIKEKLNKDKEDKSYKGYIIVSYSFPPERLDIFSDIHISIQPNSLLQTSLIIDLIKKRNIPRMEVDMHIAYLSKSWKTNKINKTIIIQPDYIENINKYYTYIFDAIVENINKKLYGEKAENMKVDELLDVSNEKKYPLPPENVKTTNISDPTKLSNHIKGVINNGNELSNFITDLDNATIQKIDSDDANNDSEFVDDLNKSNLVYDDTLNILKKVSDRDDISKQSVSDELEDDVIVKTGGYKRTTPYYIGRRKIKKIDKLIN